MKRAARDLRVRKRMIALRERARAKREANRGQVEKLWRDGCGGGDSDDERSKVKFDDGEQKS